MGESETLIVTPTLLSSVAFIMASSSTPSAYALARTPSFQKLKAAAGSDDVDDCLHIVFSQDYVQNDQLLMALGEQRDLLVAKVKWLEDLAEEGEGFLPFHDNGDIGLDSLKETVKRKKKVLAGLIKLMDAARKGREEKKFNLFWFG